MKSHQTERNIAGTSYMCHDASTCKEVERC